MLCLPHLCRIHFCLPCILTFVVCHPLSLIYKHSHTLPIPHSPSTTSLQIRNSPSLSHMDNHSHVHSLRSVGYSMPNFNIMPRLDDIKESNRSLSVSVPNQFVLHPQHQTYANQHNNMYCTFLQYSVCHMVNLEGISHFSYHLKILA